VALSFLSYKGIAPFAALMREAPALRAADLDRRVETIVTVMRDFLHLLRARTDAPFLVHDASGLPLGPVRHFVPVLPALSRGHRDVLAVLNTRVAELVATVPNAILIEEAAIARRRGLRACMERVIPPAVAAGGEFHTARFGEYLVPAYIDVIASYRTLGRCKALAVDFDDTLWEGVMADGPVVQRADLQRTLRRLREAGILLVATSKNDPRNVRWREMLLRREEFVLEKVSWNLKARSIQEAARELGIGIDGFVLLDDSAVERDLVCSQLPQVPALDPKAPQTRVWLERMLTFPNTARTEEARKRTELYRAGRERAAALDAPLDYPAMMASLGLQVGFGPAAERELDRIAELIQRTNQFNTTTIRYPRAQLAELLHSHGHRIYAATLADKFGSMGVVAAAVVRREGPLRVFEAVVMSCRAMGFGLEQLVVRRVIDAEDGTGVRFIGRYVPTERNEPCRGLWERSGFVAAAGGEWALEPGAPRPSEPPWFRVSGPGKRAA
jgi:FkbH-like protein